MTNLSLRLLLNIKVSDLTTLIQKDWITIDRSKRGSSNHKAFLTSEGIKLSNDRRKDFEFLLNFKNENSYIFTAEYSEKPLEQECFTNLINQFLKHSAKPN